MPWYVQFSITTGLGLLTTYVMRSTKISIEKKQAFASLMIDVNEFVVELGAPPTPVPPVPGA